MCSGIEVSIKELAEIIKGVVGFRGELTFDTTKPDGTPRKLMDFFAASSVVGWKPSISLPDGIASAYRWYLDTLVTISLIARSRENFLACARPLVPDPLRKVGAVYSPLLR